MSRPSGPSSAPPPPKRPAWGEDALSSVLRGPGENLANTEAPESLAETVRRRLMEGPSSLELLVESTMSNFLEVAEVIRTMESEGRVVVSGSPGSEIAMLVDDQAGEQNA